ncbi:MAG: phytanoyl-CoA dioxygenase family protein [Lentisphaeria bacterium]|nr:phytanoyl-CoA dioxygenase family protein [Lentisphaeria bacterium]NQZ71286.1 phytanoyl-CoA dioxygenase family protein [Lentisphaeria bacterium]
MSSLRADFIGKGYVLLKGVLSDSMLADLREATDRLLDMRTQGVFDDYRYQCLLDPKVFHRSYIDFLNLETLHLASADILDCAKFDFGALACLLGSIDPKLCIWHQDFAPHDPDYETLLAGAGTFLQYNCALYDDASLWIVEGSHDRSRTEAETDYASGFNGFEFISDMDDCTRIDEDAPAGMPGCMNVRLSAGDCLLYDSMLWHAATYEPDVKRATLHGGFRQPGLSEEMKAHRWGLDHNDSLLDPGYLGELGPYFGPQLERFLELKKMFPKGALD